MALVGRRTVRHDEPPTSAARLLLLLILLLQTTQVNFPCDAYVSGAPATGFLVKNWQRRRMKTRNDCRWRRRHVIQISPAQQLTQLLLLRLLGMTRLGAGVKGSVWSRHCWTGWR
jgi:hypothetical protein